MPESYAQLPADGSGRKVRTRQRTVGANIVEEQYVIAAAHERVLTTRYRFHSGALVVGASADASNVGRVYVENDPDSTVLIALTWVRFACQHGSVLATPTSPRISLKRFTFTGNSPSGTAITGSKTDTSFATKDANWDVRTAATGMTITEGVAFASFLPVSALTAVGACAPAVDWWMPEPDRPAIIRAGEGVMVKQEDAGTTSDTRRFLLDLEIEEFLAP